MSEWKTSPATVSEPTNGGADQIRMSEPYFVNIGVKGTADIIFHRWNVESVKTKAESAKGSAAKKTDDLPSYVYRNLQNEICIPGEYLRMAIINAAKFKQDPRSPRKSAMDLFKAGIVSTTDLAPIFSNNLTSQPATKWDFEDARRVQVQRNGITRVRPAFHAGWTANFDLMINLPEYINETILMETVQAAGRLIGLADFRPSYGRFGVVSFKRI